MLLSAVRRPLPPPKKMPSVPLVGLGTVVLLYSFGRFFRKRVPYPPGPSSLLPFGNAFLVPTKMEWLEYEKWGKEYKSDVVHIKALGQHLVVINSFVAAEEILERCANQTSDRPVIPMINLIGWQFTTPFLPYGDRWRSHRKLYQQTFGRDQGVAYHPVQTKQVRRLLFNLLITPQDLHQHYGLTGAALMLTVTYGHTITSYQDHLVQLNRDAVSMAVRYSLPGASVINIFPFLRHLPAWLPGTRFHQVAKECCGLLDQMLNIPFDDVKENMETENPTSCIVSELLASEEAEYGKPQGEQLLREFAGTLYAVGTDTTAAVLGVFFHAMALHPAVQSKARKELDRFIGKDRLPELSDRPNLPYIEAIYRELMRWRPVAPLSVPHSASEDLLYEGYLIPKGATVISNVWAMTHSGYDDPEDFRPERFLDARGDLNDDSRVLTYGFGRRLCPGCVTASSTVWLVIASVLATFEIGHLHDSAGQEIPIFKDIYSSDLISRPEPFQCEIKPRSDQAAQLIREAYSAEQ